jgi:hypothetical protein
VNSRFATTDTPTAAGGVEIALFEGEAVLFDAATSMLHRLGAIAAGVWLYCDGATDVTTMITELADTFDLDPDETTTVVYETLERFADEGLLEGHDTVMRAAAPEPTLAADGTEILTGPPDP